jgi:hypothetical protein
MKKITIIAAVATGLALSAATSQAQVVYDNDDAVTLTPGTNPGSVTLSDELDPNFAGSNGSINQSGTFYSYIADSSYIPTAGSPSVTYDGITFAYDVSESGNTTIDTISLDGYDLDSVYIDYTDASAFDKATLYNGTLTIQLDPSVATGDSTGYIYVFTTAPSYTTSSGTAEDGASANVNPTLAPAAVPEASTVMAGALMLLPLGIGAIRAVRKERSV